MAAFRESMKEDLETVKEAREGEPAPPPLPKSDMKVTTAPVLSK
jgi:hypothetical protein